MVKDRLSYTDALDAVEDQMTGLGARRKKRKVAEERKYQRDHGEHKYTREHRDFSDSLPPIKFSTPVPGNDWNEIFKHLIAIVHPDLWVGSTGEECATAITQELLAARDRWLNK